MSVKQIEIVFVIIVIAFIFVSVLFTRKGISIGFKPVEEDKKKSCKALRNKILISYTVSVGFLLTIKILEFIVRAIDFGVDTFNLLNTICISGAMIMVAISLICLWRWSRLRCKKSWPWLWGFSLGAFSVFPNIYLVLEVFRNSRDKNLGKT